MSNGFLLPESRKEGERTCTILTFIPGKYGKIAAIAVKKEGEQHDK